MQNARAVAAEQKYDRGAGVRGCEAANYPRKASACKGQKLGGGAKAPGSATLVPETPDSLPFSWLRETKTNTLGVYEQ